MLFVKNPSLNPWYNIALEEYLLKHFDSEFVMLWRSAPSIIVGKHQNTLAEINLPFVVTHGIPVVRRLSGGGTVFHDPGNINFTFIRRAEKEKLVDFRGHTTPVVAFLQSLGVDARFEGKNDLRVGGLKISGNAEHVFKDKVLHHGTLLFNSDLTRLNEAIKAREELFESKAIKSARSTVANITDFLEHPMSRESFMQQLEAFLKNYFPNISDFYLGSGDERAIERLMEEKYTQWHWNYAWSPLYSFRNRGEYLGSNWRVELKVAKGKIMDARISINESHLDAEHALIRGLDGLAHRPEDIEQLLKETGFQAHDTRETDWDLLKLFF